MVKRRDISKSRLKKGTLVEIVVKEGIRREKYDAPAILENYYMPCEGVQNKPGLRFVGYLMEIDRDFSVVKISQGYNPSGKGGFYKEYPFDECFFNQGVSISFNAVFSYQPLKGK